jgi:hypothetical protein
MYGQTILTANRGLGSTGINGGDGATTSLTGVSCGGGGGMGSVNTSLLMILEELEQFLDRMVLFMRQVPQESNLETEG